MKRGVPIQIKRWMSAKRTLIVKIHCPRRLRVITLSVRRPRRLGSVNGRSSNENSNSSRRRTKHSYRSNRRHENPRASMCSQRMKMSNRGKVRIMRCWDKFLGRNWSLTFSALALKSPPSVPRDQGYQQKKRFHCLRYDN